MTAINSREEALLALDDVDSLIRFCSVWMQGVERYKSGSQAFWDVAHWIAAMPKEQQDV